MERGILQLRTSQRWLSSPLYTAARARTIPPFTKHGHGRLLTKKRDLPDVKPPIGKALGIGFVLITVWGTFVLFATNQERLSSSIVRQITTAVISDSEVHEALGNNVALEPSWHLFGTPRIAGQINQLQGHVDVKFRIHGGKGGGTVYFSSIRRAKGQSFEILRFKVITDNGEVLDLSSGVSVY